MKKLFLIDGNSFCYRAYYAIRPLSNSKGQPTNAIYGFLTMLNKIITDNNLIKDFTKIQREKFVLKEYKDDAYSDIALPILKGQTISQPTTVMIMLQALELKKTDKVLEVGSGSGYNAALLSKLVKKVYTTEIIPELVEFARNNLKNIKNVMVIHCDGSKGLKKYSRCTVSPNLNNSSRHSSYNHQVTLECSPKVFFQESHLKQYCTSGT